MEGRRQALFVVAVRVERRVDVDEIAAVDDARIDERGGFCRSHAAQSSGHGARWSTAAVRRLMAGGRAAPLGSVSVWGNRVFAGSGRPACAIE